MLTLLISKRKSIKVIAYRYSTIPWVSHFKKKSHFHLSNGVFPIFCYEISATALAGRFCMARGTRDTKIEVIEVSVSSLYISSLWQYRAPTCRMVKFSSTLFIMYFSGSCLSLCIKLIIYSHIGDLCILYTKRPFSKCAYSVCKIKQFTDEFITLHNCGQL